MPGLDGLEWNVGRIKIDFEGECVKIGNDVWTDDPEGFIY